MAVEQGVTPPSLAAKPILNSFEAEIWNGFTRLSIKRNVGGFGAISAIPYGEIVAYLDYVAKIEDSEDREFFIEMIDFLDGEFLTAYAENAKKKSENASPKRPAPKRK